MATMPRFLPCLRAALMIAAIATTGYALPAQANPAPKAKEQVKKLNEPEKFIQNLGDRAIEVLADKKATHTQRDETFRKLMRDSFDLKTIARFVLGRNSWRTASKADRKEYLELFESLVVKTYSDRFALYTGEGFEVLSSQKQGKRDFVVNSQITRPDGSPATNVMWRVRNKKGKMGILDVVVEGVSMSVTQRQEYASVIQRNGGDIKPLLDMMRLRAGLKKEANKVAAKNKS